MPDETPRAPSHPPGAAVHAAGAAAGSGPVPAPHGLDGAAAGEVTSAVTQTADPAGAWLTALPTDVKVALQRLTQVLAGLSQDEKLHVLTALSAVKRVGPPASGPGLMPIVSGVGEVTGALLLAAEPQRRRESRHG